MSDIPWTMAGAEMNNFNTPNMHGPLSPSQVASGAFDMGYQGTRGAAASKLAGIHGAMNASRYGRAIMGGVAESVGFYVPGMSDQPVGSFLGMKETVAEMGHSGAKFQHRLSTTMKGTKNLVKAGRFGAAGKALMKQSGRAFKAAGGIGGAASFAGKTFMKSIPVLATAYFAYQGYQEEGVWGAVKGVGESMMYSAAFRMAGTAATGMLAGVGLVAGVGMATYALGEAGREYAKGLKNTEMIAQGSVDALSSVGAATNRQRSMMALNNTHINGRMAMGNEATLMHGDRTTGF